MCCSAELMCFSVVLAVNCGACCKLRCLQVQRWAGESKRSSLSGSNALSTVLGKITREFRGVENVYTQHTPLLKTILESLLKNKLTDSHAYTHQPSKNTVRTDVMQST